VPTRKGEEALIWPSRRGSGLRGEKKEGRGFTPPFGRSLAVELLHHAPSAARCRRGQVGGTDDAASSERPFLHRRRNRRDAGDAAAAEVLRPHHASSVVRRNSRRCCVGLSVRAENEREDSPTRGYLRRRHPADRGRDAVARPDHALRSSPTSKPVCRPERRSPSCGRGAAPAARGATSALAMATSVNFEGLLAPSAMRKKPDQSAVQ